MGSITKGGLQIAIAALVLETHQAHQVQFTMTIGAAAAAGGNRNHSVRPLAEIVTIGWASRTTAVALEAHQPQQAQQAQFTVASNSVSRQILDIVYRWTPTGSTTGRTCSSGNAHEVVASCSCGLTASFRLPMLQDIALLSMVTRIGTGRISNCGNAIPGTFTCNGTPEEMA